MGVALSDEGGVDQNAMPRFGLGIYTLGYVGYVTPHICCAMRTT